MGRNTLNCTYHLQTINVSSPSCSTRAMQKCLKKCFRVFWKKVWRLDHQHKKDMTEKALPKECKVQHTDCRLGVFAVKSAY